MKYDVRAIRLIKEEFQSSHLSFPTKSTDNMYFCLGHFDRIMVDSLGNSEKNIKNPLKAIQEDRFSLKEFETVRSANQVYSLYLLRELMKEDAQAEQASLEEIQRFWKQKRIYTVITQIHCTPPQASGPEDPSGERHLVPSIQYLEQKIRDLFKANPQMKTIISFDSPCTEDLEDNTKTRKIRCVLYDSLELADCIAIFKSNSLTSILNAIQKFSLTGQIQDSYSYIALPAEIMMQEKSALESVIQRHNLIDTRLGYISTRFSERDFRKAHQFLYDLDRKLETQWGPQMMCVTGTADYCVSLPSAGEDVLLKLIWEFVSNRELLFGAFNDIITRLGVPYRAPKQLANTEAGSRKPWFCLQHIYPNHIKNWLEAYAKTESAPSWVYSMLKLVGNLNTMSHHYSLENLTVSLIPSVSAFIYRLGELVGIPEDASSKDIEQLVKNVNFTDRQAREIQGFINCWTQITNDIMQIESHLAQHPELVPLRYYIPSTLLQFDSLFIMQCSQQLAAADHQKDNNRNLRIFKPLLVPCNTQNLYTKSPLDPSADNSCVSPLIVRIPIRDLYDPTSTLYRMAHEAAHYCGDCARNRKERFTQLSNCLIHYICGLWNSTAYAYAFEQPDWQKAEEMQQYFRNLIPYWEERFAERHQKCPSSQERYMSVSSPVLIEIMNRFLVSSTDYEEQYLLRVFPESISKLTLFQKLLQDQYQPNDPPIQIHDTELRLTAYASLSKECYADLSMIYLLRCNLPDYYLSIFDNEYNRLHQENFDGIEGLKLAEGVKAHIIRLALVIDAVRAVNGNDKMSISFQEIDDSVKSKGWGNSANSLLQEFQKYENQGHNICQQAYHVPLVLSGDDDPDTGDSQYTLSFGELHYLSQYLRKCARDLDRMFPASPSARISNDLQALRSSALYFRRDEIQWTKVQTYLISHLKEFTM